jgi:3-hydroxyisobutyrate dehydrogenase-like beta-hydroxyacid dehydrogenase
MTKERIGFVGVGLMGHGMAKNIAEKGYALTVLGHRNRAPVEDLLARGAKEAKSARELAEASDIVFICVTGSPEVEGIVRGGLKEGLKAGSIVVDCSTADPVSTMALAAELAAIGATLVDAPLSRTPKEAWEGTLDTMVGASDEVFARLKPVLDTWAGRVVHIGGTGDGHRMKLLNNFLAMGYAALYAEAVTLAQKVGITPQRFDSFMRWTLEGDRDAHKFTLANAFKDMRYLESMADAAGMSNPLGNAVKNSYALAVSLGGAADYVSMLATAVGAMNGVDIAPKK